MNEPTLRLQHLRQTSATYHPFIQEASVYFCTLNGPADLENNTIENENTFFCDGVNARWIDSNGPGRVIEAMF